MIKKILAIFGIVAADQVSKGYFLYLLTGQAFAFGRFYEVVPYPILFSRVTSFFNLIFTWNPGTSFSMFRNIGVAAPLVIIFLTGAIIGYLGYRLFARKISKIEAVALTLIVGGALGNLIDRVRFGAVVDFLDFHAFGWHWPAFNLADVCISLGIVIYMWVLIIERKNEKKVS
ncbi:MAG: signal peptidase II [Alphaproteobacteria bacterium]|nr:signal peptidase II [Alphaproteobacteria bacterium]